MSITRKSALIHIENRKLLCARSKGRDIFFNVGGKPEPGETDEEALIRECYEEINVEINPESIVFMESFVSEHIDDSTKKTVLTAYFATFSGTPHPSSEIDELAWFTSFDGDKLPSIGQEILQYLKVRDLID